MPDGNAPKPDGSAQDGVDFLRLVAQAESTNRQKSVSDIRFSYGDQWPAETQQSRNLEDRPALVINETDAYCRRIANKIRQQRPRIKVHPTDGFATKKTAAIIQGICRHVEVNSNAEIAYDHAVEMAIRGGFGYWRLRPDYIAEDSFDQDIFIDKVMNQFAVYFDPNSVQPDGSDAEKVLITDEIPKDQFRKEYPGAVLGDFQERSTGDDSPDWITEHNVRLAEYMYVERIRAKLVRLNDGSDWYEDQLPPSEVLRQANLRIVGTRDSYKRKVWWCKQTGFEILEKKQLPGRWIPVVPCYGVLVMIDGRIEKFGAVRSARDPQLMINFWNTSITECVAQAPKAKWKMAAGQDVGFENEWAKANTHAWPVLHFNQTDVDGNPAQPPERVQAEGAPEGMLVALAGAGANLRSVMGVMNSEAPRPGLFPKSERLAHLEMGESEQSNYHFYDNLTESIQHTGRIILDWTPVVFDTPNRIQRVIGEDGKPKLVTLNDTREGIDKVLNDVRTGNYDVVMETGPGNNTKREEASEYMMELMGTKLGDVIAAKAPDLVVRMFDFYGADALADRLMDPMMALDEESDVPPAAQQMIKGLQGEVQKRDQAIQALEADKKYREGVEMLRQDGQTKRELMKQAGETERQSLDGQAMLAVENAENEAWMRDVATKAQTQLSVAEINALAKLLTTNNQVQAADRAGERQIAAKTDAGRREVET